MKAWPTLGDEKWRAQLVSEIGQFLDRWADPALIELALAALEDAGREVWIKAVWMLQFVREPPAGEKRSRWSRTAQSCAAAADTLRAAITPAQRARMTRALIAILARHAQDPHPVLAQAVEVLGYTANKHDTTAIEQLEALHAGAGEPHTVSYERAAKEDFTWYERLALARKGDDPQEMVRIKYTPIGLLDRKLVEATLARIRRRDP